MISCIKLSPNFHVIGQGIIVDNDEMDEILK